MSDEADEWFNVIGKASEGASKARKSKDDYEQIKKELKEKKRNTLANLLSQSANRSQSASHLESDYGNEMADVKGDSMKEVARGFAQALSGSTRRRRR